MRVAEYDRPRQMRSGGLERFGSVLTLFEILARDHSAGDRLRRRPLGEPTFLDLVEHVAEWARDAPILLICLARPELLRGPSRPGLAASSNATTALLEPLSEDECGRLIANLVSLDRPSPEEARDENR